MKVRDLTGERFGRLTVIKRSNNPGRVAWTCKCDCGNEVEVLSGNLTMGYTTSCGCYGAERRIASRKIHGDKHTRLYNIWCLMKRRCNSEQCKAFPDYGFRGIKVCEEWEKSFLAFKKWSLENGYSDNLTLERKDNNSGYSPENCKWATRKEQNNNTRANVFISMNGEIKTLSQWCEELKMPYSTVEQRRIRGWSDIEALTIPVGCGRRRI